MINRPRFLLGTRAYKKTLLEAPARSTYIVNYSGVIITKYKYQNTERTKETIHHDVNSCSHR